MIDVGMGKYNTINFAGIKKELTIGYDIRSITALEHTTVKEYFKPVIKCDEVAAACHLAGSAAKFDLHKASG